MHPIARKLESAISRCEHLSLDDERDRAELLRALLPTVIEGMAFSAVLTFALRAARYGWGATGVECIMVATDHLKRTCDASREIAKGPEGDLQRRVVQVLQEMEMAGVL
jgi:hypothetical protein